MPTALARFFQKIENINFGWLQTLQMNLDMPVSLKPIANSAKFVIVAHVFTVLILNTIYRTKLYSSITNDRPLLKIRTINDILDTNLKPALYSYALDQFNSSKDESRFYKSIRENYIICDASDYCVNRTAFQRDTFTVKLSRKIDYLIPLLYVDGKGRSLVHVIPSFELSFMQFPVIFLKGHPLFRKINRFLMNMKENGFVDMLYKEVKRNSKKAMSLSLQSSNMQANPLNLKQFECIFIAYGVAVAISVTVFILEFLKLY
ncbi:unnamed protein product [Callosobruchus maculatus]|uniref:Ionotropic glutamate receptor C-terminal domain-containing protein n=1 Tax=Callosobruchus maculatus TaxID=64391 RepID=A0A653BY03_CALMS|nr:unnamed protein product [Callosobruchus maculatus]VEN40925.1 unnamed protein product [Callosobruchus maculatus]